MTTTTRHSLFYVAVCQVQPKEDEDGEGTTKNTVGIAEPQQPCNNNHKSTKTTTTTTTEQGSTVLILASYFHQPNFVQSLQAQLDDDHQEQQVSATCSGTTEPNQRPPEPACRRHEYSSKDRRPIQQEESFRVDQSHFESYAKYKLQKLATRHVHTKSFYSYFESPSLGSWHIKGLEEPGMSKSLIYVVVTSCDYSLVVAAECLDDLSETYQKTLKEQESKQGSTWTSLFPSPKLFHRPDFLPEWMKRTNTNDSSGNDLEEEDDGDNANKREEETKTEPSTPEEQELSPLDQCCQWIAQTYGSPIEDGLPNQLHAQIDEEYDETAKKMQRLFRQIEAAKEQLHQNIVGALENTEKIEDLQKVADDLVVQAAVFKKKAKKLKWKIRPKEYYSNPLMLAMALGFFLGFWAGGPTGAAVLTELSSVAAAQAVEAGAGALILATGYLGARSAMDRWAFRQTPILL